MDEINRENMAAEAGETEKLREQVKSYEANIQALGAQVEKYEAEKEAMSAQMKSYEQDIATLKSLYEEHSKLFDSLRRMNVQTTEGVQDVLKSNTEEVREAARAVAESVKSIKGMNPADQNRPVMEAFAAGQAQMIDALTGLQDSIVSLERVTKEAAEKQAKSGASGLTLEKAQELFQQSDEFNHKENVRVYRNIQSATDDLLQKQTETLKEEIAAASEKEEDKGEVTLAQKVILGLLAVSVILQILSIFHVLG